jgi:hypothetical protein
MELSSGVRAHQSTTFIEFDKVKYMDFKHIRWGQFYKRAYENGPNQSYVYIRSITILDVEVFIFFPAQPALCSPDGSNGRRIDKNSWNNDNNFYYDSELVEDEGLIDFLRIKLITALFKLRH